MNIALSMTAWRRPQYFEEVLKSMVNAGAASIASIIISIDGGYAKEQEAMRSIAERLLPNAKVVCHEENLGCAGNTFYALNAAFADEDVEAVIHLEDDTLLHHQFFEYMREALPRYADNPNIWSIGGYNNGKFEHGITEDWGSNNVGLHDRFTCWGWATYRRVWDEVKDDWFGIKFDGQFDPAAYGDIQNFHAARFGGVGKLINSPHGSWAHPFNSYWRVLKPNRFEITPDESLVQNIGKDEGVWTEAMTYAALQKTNRFHPNRNYMGWDFDMIDMELENYE
tara:strand:+ start:3977 stop:4822 length:846 start_codon:yes stop_codon:yes gene_type:complete